MNQKISKLTQHQEELQRFVNDKQQLENQRNQLMKNYQSMRLKQAIITKELRLINRHFSSFSLMGDQIQTFIHDYLAEKEGQAHE